MPPSYSTPPSRPPHQTSDSLGRWEDAWEVSATPMVEMEEEIVSVARHAATNRQVWWHQVKDVPTGARQAWPDYFQKCAQAARGQDFADLLGWGWVGERWCYVTDYPEGELLLEWKPRRQTTSATSLRMQLLQQTIQIALQAESDGTTARFLAVELITVQQTQTKEQPYRLQAHGWMPTKDPETAEGQILAGTERMLNLLTEGMPWPLELTRAFFEGSLSPRQRLQQCEAILQAQSLRSARPAMPEPLPSARMPRRRWQWGVGAALVISALAGGLWWQSTQPQVSLSTPSAPSVPPTQATVPAALPLPSGPSEFMIAQETLAAAKGSRQPVAMLEAAKRVLELKPDDADTVALVTTLIHQEVRRQIELSANAPLDAHTNWALWVQRGFHEARLLNALQQWPQSPSDSVQELQLLAEEGSTAAWVLLGQLAANPRAERPDLERAFQCFAAAARGRDPAADYLVGECFLFGKGVPAEPTAAQPFLQRAAAAGDSRAMQQLGNCYLKGRGVSADAPEAVRWFTQAIGAGNLRARSDLALIYLNGDGLPRDIKRGLELLQAGADQGDPECNYQLAVSAEQAQVATARAYYERAAQLGHALAKTWLSNHPAPR